MLILAWASGNRIFSLYMNFKKENNFKESLSLSKGRGFLAKFIFPHSISQSRMNI